MKGPEHVSIQWEALTTKSGFTIKYQLYEGNSHQCLERERGVCVCVCVSVCVCLCVRVRARERLCMERLSSSKGEGVLGFNKNQYLR